jgi:hypothetical protein
LLALEAINRLNFNILKHLPAECLLKKLAEKVALRAIGGDHSHLQQRQQQHGQEEAPCRNSGSSSSSVTGLFSHKQAAMTAVC